MWLCYMLQSKDSKDAGTGVSEGCRILRIRAGCQPRHEATTRGFELHELHSDHTTLEMPSGLQPSCDADLFMSPDSLLNLTSKLRLVPLADWSRRASHCDLPHAVTALTCTDIHNIGLSEFAANSKDSTSKATLYSAILASSPVCDGRRFRDGRNIPRSQRACSQRDEPLGLHIKIHR